MTGNPWRSKTLLGFVAVLTVASMAFAACGGDDDDDDNGGADTPAAGETAGNGGRDIDYSDLSGEVVIDGSSTVGPVSEAVAEEFGKVSDVRVSVGISGTGGGFEKFCSGETDINDASRAIKDTEIEACAGEGVEYLELKVGVDGLTIVVNPDNDFAECLTWSQLRAMWDSASSVDNWTDVDPTFPDESLVLFGPGPDSGTFDFFTEEINGEAGRSRSDYTASEDDNQLVQGVQNETNALGYFGYAYFQESEDVLKAVEIDKDQDADGEPIPEAERAGCVAPTPETINDGSYSLSRPLYIYVSLSALEEPAVRGYVEYYIDNAGALVEDVGYIALPDAEYDAARTALQGS